MTFTSSLHVRQQNPIYKALAIRFGTAVFRLTPFRTYVDSSQVQQGYIKIGAQIRTHDAEYIFELLNCRDQEVALENISNITKQIDPE